jgi:RimJ/RimL family protein N-acetyltransferase
MARFLLDRATHLPGVTAVIAHTLPETNASTRILEKLGMTYVGSDQEDGADVWLWRKNLEATNEHE